MTISKIALSVAVVLSLASPAFCQGKQSRMERELQKQRIINTERQMTAAMSTDSNAAGWVDISAAPADFPFPVFRGTQTKMMRINVGQPADLNKYARQLTLTSRDSASIVAQWYRKYLPGAGYKLDEKMPSQIPGGRAFMVKGESANYMAMISIVTRDDANGPASQIQLTATAKPPAKNKK